MTRIRLKDRKCPVCDHTGLLDIINYPIDHWGCGKCNTVFILDECGCLGALHEDIEYKPKK